MKEERVALDIPRISQAESGVVEFVGTAVGFLKERQNLRGGGGGIGGERDLF
jgi:hypothetical protein